MPTRLLLYKGKLAHLRSISSLCLGFEIFSDIALKSAIKVKFRGRVKFPNVDVEVFSTFFPFGLVGLDDVSTSMEFESEILLDWFELLVSLAGDEVRVWVVELARVWLKLKFNVVSRGLLGPAMEGSGVLSGCGAVLKMVTVFAFLTEVSFSIGVSFLFFFEVCLVVRPE